MYRRLPALSQSTQFLRCVFLPLAFVALDVNAQTYWCQKDPDADGIPTYSSGRQAGPGCGFLGQWGSSCCPTGYSNPTANPTYWPGDNCSVVANSNQINTDSDAEGDACDADDDNDGLLDVMDPLPLQAKFNRDANYKGSQVQDSNGVQ